MSRISKFRKKVILLGYFFMFVFFASIVLIGYFYDYKLALLVLFAILGYRGIVVVKNELDKPKRRRKR